MASTSNPDKVALRFAPYVEELHQFFASHSMHFGQVEDLSELSAKLEAPGPFRSELSSMVRSVIFRERGSVPRSDLLAIVAFSIAGPGIDTANGQASKPVSQLTEFIAGVLRAPRDEPGPRLVTEFSAEDGSAFASEQETAEKQGQERRSGAIDIASSSTYTAVPRLAPNPLSGRAVDQSPENDNSEEYLTSDLREALKRMETTSLEFRLYLDSIEERVRRIEPRGQLSPETPESAEDHPGIVPLQASEVGETRSLGPPDGSALQFPAGGVDGGLVGSVASNPFAAQTLAANPYTAKRLEDPWAESSAARQEQLLHADESELHTHESELHTDESDSPQARVRWDGLRSPDAKRWYAGAGAFVVLLAAFLIWESPIAHPAAAGGEHLDAGVFNRLTRGALVAKPTPYGKSAPTTGQRAGTTFASVGPTQERTLTGRGEPIPNLPTSGNGAFTNPAGSDNSQAAGNVAGAAAPAIENDATLASLPEVQREGKRSGTKGYSAGKPAAQRSLAVSSGVMAGNLIYAPPPTYPRLASYTHVQGQVLLQAVVSRSGKVANLHVIRGPHLLRGAAMSAVYKWRYRPYLVSGRAVDVATIVSVDFVLHH